MAPLLWTQKQDIGPSARGWTAVTHDLDRERTVLFGGWGGVATTLGDTWEWDGQDWTQVDNSGPAARFGHALAYDAARRRAVLFGGLSGSSYVGDTWEWDGESWVQAADTGPGPRYLQAMTYDSRRQRIVLHGGVRYFLNSRQVLFEDTWEWDGASWTQREELGPGRRFGHSMAYLAATERIVLFGNAMGSGAEETWEWDGTAWLQASDIGPSNRCYSALAADAERVLLFGGRIHYSGDAEALADTWTWDGRRWTQRQDIGPSPRGGHGAAYDAARQRFLIFGGFAGYPEVFHRDTWVAFERPPGT